MYFVAPEGHADNKKPQHAKPAGPLSLRFALTMQLLAKQEKAMGRDQEHSRCLKGAKRIKKVHLQKKRKRKRERERESCHRVLEST